MREQGSERGSARLGASCMCVRARAAETEQRVLGALGFSPHNHHRAPRSEVTLTDVESVSETDSSTGSVVSETDSTSVRVRLGDGLVVGAVQSVSETDSSSVRVTASP